MEMKKLKTPYAYIINTVVLAAILVLGNMLFAGGALNRATKSVILQCGVYSIMAVSLNICTGYLGQLPLGHAGFMAVGAYAGALFWKAVPGLPTPVAIVCGILVAGLAASLFGVIIGVPALRLKGDYLAIITLGFGMIIVNIINNLPFCGQDGLSLGSASSSLYKNGLGFGSKGKVSFLWVALLVTLLCLVMMFMFMLTSASFNS